jgi:hypothetical protein
MRESGLKAGVDLFCALAGVSEGGHRREVDRAGLPLPG